MEVESYTAALEEIGTLETALATARLKLEAAQQSQKMALQDKETRLELINAVEQASRQLKKDIEESSTLSLSLSALTQAEPSVPMRVRHFPPNSLV